MLLLDTTINVDNILHIVELLGIFGGWLGLFFKMKTEIDVLKTDLQNTKINVDKLETRMSAEYVKIEDKINILFDKVDKLPEHLLTLIQKLK